MTQRALAVIVRNLPLIQHVATFQAKKFYVAFYSQSKKPCFSGSHKTTGNIIIVVLVVMFRICKVNGMVTALKMIITKR
jgi:hypothetical protein